MHNQPKGDLVLGVIGSHTAATSVIGCGKLPRNLKLKFIGRKWKHFNMQYLNIKDIGLVGSRK